MNFIRRICNSRMVYPYGKFNEISPGRRDYKQICITLRRLNASVTESKKLCIN